MLEVETESTRSYSVQKLLWKRLWAYRKADNGMNVYCIRLLDDGKHKQLIKKKEDVSVFV
jgi:hypothetical protein